MKSGVLCADHWRALFRCSVSPVWSGMGQHYNRQQTRAETLRV